MSFMAGFLGDIVEHPDDDTPRLVYADWLDENGDPERAEFIRVGCALARLPREHPDWLALRRRENDLIDRNKEEWFALVRGHCAFWEVRRGFVDEVRTSLDYYAEVADELYQQHAVQNVRLSGVPDEGGCLAELPTLAFVAYLDLSSAPLMDAGAIALSSSPHPIRLRRLILPSAGIGPEGASALSSSPALARLRALDLRDNWVGTAGVGALLDGRHWTLRYLDLCGTYSREVPGQHTASGQINAGTDAVVLLAEHPAARHLRTLLLRNNDLDQRAARALVESPYLADLRVLDLIGNHVSDEDQAALAARFGDRVRFAGYYPPSYE